jgi:hypothetical protein
MTYQNSNPVYTILAIIFYVALIILAFYSLLAVYALLKFGRSRTVGIIISLCYLIITAGFYFAALTNLNALH